MNRKIKKEFILLILIILVVAFILGILFYDILPTDETIVSKEYEFGDNVKTTLEEIYASGNDIDVEENSVIKSYEVTEDDLEEYSSSNSYEVGKQDPFAESAEPVDRTNVTTKTKEAQKNTSQSSNQSEEKGSTEDAVNTLTQMNIVSNTTNTTNETENEKATNDKVENTTVKNEVTTGRFFEKPNSK